MFLEIGDLDQRRNLKVRAFVSLALNPIFAELRQVFGFEALGRRGITPGQYFQDFQYVPRPHGYGSQVDRVHRIRLCRSVARRTRTGDGTSETVERLVIETRVDLLARPALGAPRALGFDPPLGARVRAGQGRVLHVLTRPPSGPGTRHVREIPPELAFLREQPLEGEFPTVEMLHRVAEGYEDVTPWDGDGPTGVWGMPHSDVFQHVNAREYLHAMENRVTALLAAARLPLERYCATRARIIFRRPSFVGERFVLRCRLYRRQADLLALGSYHKLAATGGVEERPSVVLRFDAELR